VGWKLDWSGRKSCRDRQSRWLLFIQWYRGRRIIFEIRILGEIDVQQRLRAVLSSEVVILTTPGKSCVFDVRMNISGSAKIQS